VRVTSLPITVLLYCASLECIKVASPERAADNS
jgi:hypothetical protein